MSTETDSTGDSGNADLKINEAQKALCAFLAERSELAVNYEEPDDGRDRRHDCVPVARTTDGNKAEVSDFPSGKNDGVGNFSKSTYTRYRDTVNDFIQSQDLTDLKEVTPRELGSYNRLLQQREYARTTRDGILEMLEVFWKWAETNWWAERGDDKLSDTVARKREDLNVRADEKSRAGDDNHRISTERAEEIIGDLAKHHYASRRMVEFLLIYHVGMRQSGLLAINCDDVKPRKGVIEIRNRPEETELRLKRGNKGERNVNIVSGVMSVVTDYLENNRTEPQDGSDALLTSWAGRIDSSTLYRDIAGLTKCGECENDDGKPLTKQNASDCPEAIGPHDLRRTAITRMRDEGISWNTISGRVNATTQMLKTHYDSPTPAQAANRRKEEILNSLSM